MTTLGNHPPVGMHVPTMQEVLAEAHIAKFNASRMGGNGSEFNDIDVLVQKARNGILDAATAIMQIQAIPEEKHGNGGHGLMG